MNRSWAPEYTAASDARPVQDYADELVDLVTDAARLRLRSDVPVGAYLSGGLDSTVIASVVRRFTDTPLETFSVTFDAPEFDESAHQQEVVRQLGTKHCSFRCTADHIADVFPDVVWHAEAPVVRTAPAPMFLLSRLVRQHGYKVVLTGEGSDEVLGGYDVFKEAKIRRFWARQPESRFRAQLLKRLYPYQPQLQAQSPEYLKRFFHVGPDATSSPFFSHLPRWQMTAGLKRFFSDDVRRELAGHDALDDLRAMLPDRYHGWDDFSQAQYLETSLLLPGYILSSQGDRVAMAHAVEGRFPFLDHRLVEFATRLPSSLKMKGLQEKYLLRRAFAPLIPDAVRTRKKQPYRAPDAESFFVQSGEAQAGVGSGLGPRTARRTYVDELLSPESLRGSVFNVDAVSSLVRKVRAGGPLGTRDNMALVGILSTELLRDQFVRKVTVQ